MQLMTIKSSIPCHFTHLVTRDVQLQSSIILMTKSLDFLIIMKFHVIINLGMMCKVHVISTQSFYSTKCYKRCLDGLITCVKNLQTCYELLHMTKSQPNLTWIFRLGNLAQLAQPKVNPVQPNQVSYLCQATYIAQPKNSQPKKPRLAT